MKNKNLISNIEFQINKGDKKAPFLFLGKNLEILNSDINTLSLELMKKYSIPKSYLYIFPDNWEKIKIKDIKNFIEYSNSKPPFKFQIFLIENISRLTTSASNSLLKFFEEPDESNLIFLTNSSESGVLDTILSRVQNIDTKINSNLKKDDFVSSMINNYIQKKDNEIISYYFRNKLEKQEYINFLENLILYIKENLVLINYLDEIEEDINSIKQNNVNPRYIVDKWLLKI